MSQISRLHDAQIENGEIIDAGDLDDEFNQLVNSHNDVDSRLDDVENNAVTLDGVKTFTSIPVGPSSNPTTDNQFARKAYVDTIVQKFLYGPAVTWQSATTVRIPAGFSCRDSTNAATITFSANKDVVISGSGANGLDTGSEANDTWYYLYAIRKSSDGTVAGLLSATNESVSGTITQPADYDQKRQLPIAVRNDGSGNLIHFRISEGWPFTPAVYWVVDFGATGLTLGPTAVLDGGTQTSDTAVTCSAFIPPCSTRGIFQLGVSANTQFQAFLGKNGGSEDELVVQANGDLADIRGQSDTDTSQRVQYRIDAGANFADIQVVGFIVTGIY